MHSVMNTARRFGPGFALALVLCGTAAPGTAGPLIQFTDPQPAISSTGVLSDLSANHAVSWTQSVASSNVKLSVVINSNVGAVSGQWYVTDSIGAGTVNANVVASGLYNLGPPLSAQQLGNFDLAPRITLGSGLSFAPGTYFLVLDGPAGPFLNNADWIGDVSAPAILAPGFSLGTYFFSADPDGFAPASGFSPLTEPVSYVFELDGDTAVIPLPASLPLMAAGLALFGLLSRRFSRPH